MLVWEIRSRGKQRGKGKSNGNCEDGESAQQAEWRDKFVQNLQSAGLLLEKVLLFILLVQEDCQNSCSLMSLTSFSLSALSIQEESANEKKTIHFLKVSAPWDVLVYYAEELCLRAPLQVSKAVPYNHLMGPFKYLCPFFGN